MQTCNSYDEMLKMVFEAYFDAVVAEESTSQVGIDRNFY